MNEERSDKLGSGVASQLEKADGMPFLAGVDTVSDLLRVFVAGCVDRRGDYLDGKPEASDAMQRDSAEAQALADLLNGGGPRSSSFFVQPWNSPAQMGQHLIDTYSLECQPEEAAYCVLMGLLGEVYATVDWLADNDLPVDANAWQIEALVENYTHAILGLEDPSADDEA